MVIDMHALSGKTIRNRFLVLYGFLRDGRFPLIGHAINTIRRESIKILMYDRNFLSVTCRTRVKVCASYTWLIDNHRVNDRKRFITAVLPDIVRRRGQRPGW